MIFQHNKEVTGTPIPDITVKQKDNSLRDYTIKGELNEAGLPKILYVKFIFKYTGASPKDDKPYIGSITVSKPDSTIPVVTPPTISLNQLKIGETITIN